MKLKTDRSTLVSHEVLPENVNRSGFAARFIRSKPLLYYALVQSQLFTSRYVLAARDRIRFRQNRSLLRMTAEETRHCAELRDQGFTILPDVLNADQVDRFYEAIDRRFKNLEIDEKDSYSYQRGWRSLRGLSYDQLEKTEKLVSMEAPLLAMPELVEVYFRPEILRIVANFLGIVPAQYKAMVIRDFPLDRPREASNFHRDTDLTDSVQVFIYLVDIDDETGPLVYVPGTNKHDYRSCHLRVTRDLGTPGYDGRITDEEVAKFYPTECWRTLNVKRGSAVIIHGNGFHKGPCWKVPGAPENRPRTALRAHMGGNRRESAFNVTQIRASDLAGLSPLQSLFTRFYRPRD